LNRKDAGGHRVAGARAGALFRIAIVPGSVGQPLESEAILLACLIFNALADLLSANGFLFLMSLPF
jgi:hypothetical protein